VQLAVDVEAVMRDGTVLRADVRRPDGDGPWPVLLVRSPYGKQDPDILALLEPRGAVRRGYLVVIQDTRGRHRSQGDWQPLVHERDDGHDTVRWAARLPGSDGRVAMYGPSYLGHTQWAALTAEAPELVAAATEFTWNDPYEALVARGGARELGLVTQWTLTLGEDVLRRRHADQPDELRQHMDELTSSIDELATSTSWRPPTLDRLRLPVPGAPGGPVLPRVSDRLDRLTAPTLTVAGWYDAFLQGSLDNHIGARATGLPAALIVGPWSHGNQTRHLGGTDFGPTADASRIDGGASLRTRELDWFDAQLQRTPPAPVPANRPVPPPVLVFVMGVNEWRGMDSWPPPAVGTAWYLRTDGVLSTTPPGPDEAADTYRHDPADPVPTCGGHLLLTPDFPPGPLDQATVESRPDVLVHTGPVLTEPLEVIGRVRVHLVAASTAPSTDWVARLCDVDADGVSRTLADGVLRVEQADAGPREHVIDLWSTAHVFRPGHRLRLQIASSSFPRWDPNPGTEAPARIAVQTVHHDAARPSRIVLPVTSAG
jgi:uncharacterized protein